MAAIMKMITKMTVFWDVAPCSLAKFDNVSEMFNSSIIKKINDRSDDRGSKYLCSVHKLVSDYTDERLNFIEKKKVSRRCHHIVHVIHTVILSYYSPLSTRKMIQLMYRTNTV
jgi:hypothetical protein